MSRQLDGEHRVGSGVTRLSRDGAWPPWPDFPYISELTWERLPCDARIACLCLPADQAWVDMQIEAAADEAAHVVERRWLRLDRNVTRAEVAEFELERRAARQAVLRAFWPTEDRFKRRCAHGASPNGCRVRSCLHQWSPPPPPADRFYKGALRQRILHRDNYTCQYCQVKVFDHLPRHHPLKANIDHYIPYPLGPTTFENGRTACVLCNAVKGNQVPWALDGSDMGIDV